MPHDLRQTALQELNDGHLVHPAARVGHLDELTGPDVELADAEDLGPGGAGQAQLPEIAKTEAVLTALLAARVATEQVVRLMRTNY